MLVKMLVKRFQILQVYIMGSAVNDDLLEGPAGVLVFLHNGANLA
jgi:hypothetical protein